MRERSGIERQGWNIPSMEAGMTRNVVVGRMSRWAILTGFLAFLMVSPSIASAAYSVPICGLYPGSASWSEGRYCNTASTQYPGIKGWYGYVGVGGGACGPIIPGDNPPPGMSGICLAPSPEPVWKHVSGGWNQSALAVGTRVYVYPMSKDWRWIYTNGSWYAIKAERLFLVWRI